ncbi:hypothetical protein BKI52_31595 [marine bacterium AO1-C]|nr:hypothetical protein BKI52_31595 [marine bacterium AO1-C]
MMQWYIPITILPGISLLILSTSNFLIDINREIKDLKNQGEAYEKIMQMKLSQLIRLSWVISCLYVTVLCLTLSGLIASIEKIGIHLERLAVVFLVLGITVMMGAIVILIVFAIRGVKIRQAHLKI